MELAFSSKTLRDICENIEKAEEEFGEQIAEILKRRLADLRAAPCANDVVVGQPRVINGNPHSKICITLHDNCSIIISANHNDMPILEAGNVDWTKVTRIKINSIGREHE